MRRVILNFHGLGTPARDLEPGEAAYWVAPEVFEATLELADRLADRVQTHITFDDGNASDIEIAAPALARHGRVAEFFVLADRIGQPGSLSAADLGALIGAGHRIGSHGAAHVDWRALDDAGFDRELVAARAEIASAAGAPVDAAAIPFGRYSGRVLRALKRAGFTRVYSSDGGPWRSDRAPVARTSPTGAMTLADIERVLLGPEPLSRSLRRAAARQVKRWI